MLCMGGVLRLAGLEGRKVKPVSESMVKLTLYLQIGIMYGVLQPLIIPLLGAAIGLLVLFMQVAAQRRLLRADADDEKEQPDSPCVPLGLLATLAFSAVLHVGFNWNSLLALAIIATFLGGPWFLDC